jgi:hypothetical protein
MTADISETGNSDTSMYCGRNGRHTCKACKRLKRSFGDGPDRLHGTMHIRHGGAKGGHEGWRHVVLQCCAGGGSPDGWFAWSSHACTDPERSSHPSFQPYEEDHSLLSILVMQVEPQRLKLPTSTLMKDGQSSELSRSSTYSNPNSPTSRWLNPVGAMVRRSRI